MRASCGYAVHHLSSRKAKRLLKRHKMTQEDIRKALVVYEREEKVYIRTIIGVNDDGLIGNERAHWHPGLPDAFASGFVIVPWALLYGLLGRVSASTVDTLLNDMSGTKH